MPSRGTRSPGPWSPARSAPCEAACGMQIVLTSASAHTTPSRMHASRPSPSAPSTPCRTLRAGPAGVEGGGDATRGLGGLPSCPRCCTHLSDQRQIAGAGLVGERTTAGDRATVQATAKIRLPHHWHGEQASVHVLVHSQVSGQLCGRQREQSVHHGT